MIFGRIDNVFDYSIIDVAQFKDALRRTLSLWSIVSGRIIGDNYQYVTEFCDKSIPLTYVENFQVERRSDLLVVVDDLAKLQPFVDSAQNKPRVEVLLRLKVTRLVQTNESIRRTSFSHLIDDADSNLSFLRDLSLIYQMLQLTVPHSIFERQSLNEDEDSKFSSLPMMKQYPLADRREAVLTRPTKEHSDTDSLKGETAGSGTPGLEETRRDSKYF